MNAVAAVLSAAGATATGVGILFRRGTYR
jgi:hypothetical protein